jgi:hypothetical protein
MQSRSFKLNVINIERVRQLFIFLLQLAKILVGSHRGHFEVTGCQDVKHAILLALLAPVLASLFSSKLIDRRRFREAVTELPNLGRGSGPLSRPHWGRGSGLRSAKRSIRRSEKRLVCHPRFSAWCSTWSRTRSSAWSRTRTSAWCSTRSSAWGSTRSSTWFSTWRSTWRGTR